MARTILIQVMTTEIVLLFEHPLFKQALMCKSSINAQLQRSYKSFGQCSVYGHFSDFVLPTILLDSIFT